MPAQKSLTWRVLAGSIPFVVALSVYALWRDEVRTPLVGDEPHYLAQAESLVSDRDVDLSDEYREGSTVWALFPRLSESHGIDVKDDGRVRPIQSVGLPVLLAPANAVAGTPASQLNLVRWEVVFLAGLFAHQLWFLFRDLDSAHRARRALVWAAVCFSLPIMGYVTQIYPEVPAALLVVIGLRGFVRIKRDARFVLLVGVAAALLPWFGTRFQLIALALAVAGFLRAGSATDSRRARLRSAWPAMVPFLVSNAVLAVYNTALYGTPLVNRVYADATNVDQSPLNTYKYGIGLILSPIQGLLPFAPIFFVALVGTLALWRRSDTAVRVLMAAVLIYVLVVAPFGSNGFAPPARFAVVLVPFLAVAAFRTLLLVPPLTPVFVALAVFSITATISVADPVSYFRLYEDVTPVAGPVKLVAGAFPRFTPALGTDEVNVGPANRVTTAAAPADGLVSLGSWDTWELRAAEYRAHIAIDERPAGVSAEHATVTVVVDRAKRRHDELTTDQVLNFGLADAAATAENTKRLDFDVEVDTSGEQVRLSVWSDEPVRAAGAALQPTDEPEHWNRPVTARIPLAVAWLACVGAGAYLVDRAATHREMAPLHTELGEGARRAGPAQRG